MKPGALTPSEYAEVWDAIWGAPDLAAIGEIEERLRRAKVTERDLWEQAALRREALAEGGHTQQERDTDTALHEKELEADRPMPPTVLARLRRLARRLGVPESFVQR